MSCSRRSLARTSTPGLAGWSGRSSTWAKEELFCAFFGAFHRGQKAWLTYLLRSSTVSMLAKRCPDFFVPTNFPLSALKVTAPSSSQLRSSKAALARRVSPACRPPPACKLNNRSWKKIWFYVQNCCRGGLFINFWFWWWLWVCWDSPEVFILHGPDRPLGRLWIKLQLESLVVADLLLVRRHINACNNLG